MVRDTVRRFATDVLRPAAAGADAACAPPADVLARAAELALPALSIAPSSQVSRSPPELTTTSAPASALARGDLGLAVALLAQVAQDHDGRGRRRG